MLDGGDVETVEEADMAVLEKGHFWDDGALYSRLWTGGDKQII